MNTKQLSFIMALAIVGVSVPWFSVGMFFIGAAIGAFIAVVLSD